MAYFSAEFGLTECLSVFAGGLGVLAGDHLKGASDLGVPLVGVGLLYQQGYFKQYLNPAGWQQETYEDNDFRNLPLSLELQPDGRPLTIEVAYDGRDCPNLAGSRRPGQSVPARYQRGRQSPGRSRYHRSALRRRSGDAPETGDPARHRRTSRAGSAWPGAHRLSHERGPFCLPRGGVGSPADGEAEALVCRGARCHRRA